MIHWLAYQFWLNLLRLVFALTCRIHVVHRERSQRPGAWILAPNHISHFDPPILSLACLRLVDWMAMEELFRGKVMPFLLRAVGAFPVHRGRPDRAALRTAARRLSDGRVVGIFPEGGIRAGEGSILEGAPMRPGVSLVASSSQSAVLPCVIVGSDRLYNRRQWLPFRRTCIWILFGEIVESHGGDRKELEKKLGLIYPGLLRELVQTCGLRDEDLPKTPQARKGLEP
jgi:1-acyl-sn-glycerol-3-phosphate acyltransferase